MPLPVKTTSQDVRDIVRYLKTKPTGATISHAAAALDKRLLDSRKLSAYQTWGFVTRESERLKLTERGREFARRPDAEEEFFRGAINDVAAYRSVLEWVHHQDMASVTAIDVAAHLHEHHSQAVGEDAKDQTLRENAVG